MALGVHMAHKQSKYREEGQRSACLGVPFLSLFGDPCAVFAPCDALSMCVVCVCVVHVHVHMHCHVEEGERGEIRKLREKCEMGESEYKTRHNCVPHFKHFGYSVAVGGPIPGDFIWAMKMRGRNIVT